jgi:RNA polymerase sigma-70 factor (subfamily 1)
MQGCQQIEASRNGIISISIKPLDQVTRVKAEERQDESDLIRRFKAGDEKALRILLDGCKDVVQARAYHLMSRAVRRRVSVADVLQEARITAFERRHELENRGPGSFGRWLLGIVEMKARRAVQRHADAAMRSVDREVTRGCRPDTAACAGVAPSPSQAAIGSELRDVAARAMDSLPDDYREVLHLSTVEHLKTDEIAERMGRSRDAVKKLRGRALAAFSEAFRRMQGEGHE